MPPRSLRYTGTQPILRRYIAIMRFAFALIGLTVIGAVTGVGDAAIGSARDMSVKQRLELDSAIDRIVAEHKEQKEQKEQREAAVAMASAPAKSEIPAEPVVIASPRPAPPNDGKNKVSESAERSPKAADRTESKVAERPEPKAGATSQRKAQKPRSGWASSRSNSLIPHAFVSLPKFAATTLLGLR